MTLSLFPSTVQCPRPARRQYASLPRAIYAVNDEGICILHSTSAQWHMDQSRALREAVGGELESQDWAVDRGNPFAQIHDRIHHWRLLS